MNKYLICVCIYYGIPLPHPETTADTFEDVAQTYSKDVGVVVLLIATHISPRCISCLQK
jgi:hypothetical protein